MYWLNFTERCKSLIPRSQISMKAVALTSDCACYGLSSGEEGGCEAQGIKQFWREARTSKASRHLRVLPKMVNCWPVITWVPFLVPVEADLFYKPHQCLYEGQKLLVTERKALFSFTLISELPEALLLLWAVQAPTTRGSRTISCLINWLQTHMLWLWLYQFPQKHKSNIDLIISLLWPSKMYFLRFSVVRMLANRVLRDLVSFLQQKVLWHVPPHPPKATVPIHSWGLIWQSPPPRPTPITPTVNRPKK